MNGLMLLALVILGVVAYLALSQASDTDRPVIVNTLARTVTVLVLAYVALRLVNPEDIPALLKALLRYLK